METIYYTATTLDGYIADPDNSLDWLFQFPDGPGDEYKEFIANVGAICMGSTTYRWVFDHMKKPEGGMEPWPYEQPAWVFSSRELPPYPDADIRFVKGDIAPIHREMAEDLLNKLVVEKNFDMAYSEDAELGHAFSIPFEYVIGKRDIPVIPFFACLPTVQR